MRQDVAAKALPRAQLVNLGLTGHKFIINLLVLIFQIEKNFLSLRRARFVGPCGFRHDQ